MLSRGYSLIEMLFALTLSSLLIFGALSFYPNFQLSIIQVYQKYRLNEAIEQTLAGMIKDIKRAGFIANDPSSVTQHALEINATNTCIIIRYDSESHGKWRYFPQDAKNSDVFAYRLNKNNLEYQTGITHCDGTGWEKLFDPNEIKVTQFHLTQTNSVITIALSAELKSNTLIKRQLIYRVRNENS